jgi:pimeloyl-ACP methyl ester carboxylesterase
VEQADFRSGEVTNGEVTIRYSEAGDPDAPLMLLLHGFPEFRAAWKKVMTRLADRFHAVAPDQRGYNLSSKPQGVEAYRARHLAADVAVLADALSPGKPFVLAGHDWGASVAYAYAFAHSDRLSHLVIANGVHPACFQRAIFEDHGQRQASQYINRLKAADAEQILAEDGYRRLMRMISGFSRTDWMTEEEADAYRRAWSQPGALTAMLNWYRASPMIVPEPGEMAPHSPILDIPPEAMTVRVPHLLIWGEADEALRPVCFDGLQNYAPQLTIRKIAGAGHWILHEKPDEVAATIRTFCA